MKGDRIFGLIAIVVALGFILSATSIQTSFLSDPVGPKTFPYIVGGVMILCGLSMVLRPDPEPAWPDAMTFVRIGLALVVLVGYTFALKPLGFLIPTAIASGILSYQINARALPAALTGLGLSLGLFIIFKFGLGLGLVAVPKVWLG